MSRAPRATAGTARGVRVPHGHRTGPSASFGIGACCADPRILSSGARMGGRPIRGRNPITGRPR
eukprot:6378020-Alexandrium_andersonii.AAC.1